MTYYTDRTLSLLPFWEHDVSLTIHVASENCNVDVGFCVGQGPPKKRNTLKTESASGTSRLSF